MCDGNMNIVPCLGDVSVPIPKMELQIMKTQYAWLTIRFAFWSALLKEKFAEIA